MKATNHCLDIITLFDVLFFVFGSRYVAIAYVLRSHDGAVSSEPQHGAGAILHASIQ